MNLLCFLHWISGGCFLVIAKNKGCVVSIAGIERRRM